MQKGQLFSLDFIISMVAVTAAIALLIHSIEVNAYSQKEQQLQDELKQVAETAGDLLVSNQDIVCELVDSSDNKLFSLNNCLSKVDTTKIPPGQWPPTNNPGWWTAPGRVKKARPLYKEKLGIPDEFSCLIETTGGGLGGNYSIVLLACLDNPNNAKNIVSSSRRIVVYQEDDDSTVPKSEFESCLQGAACRLIEGTATIRVWKE
jgi:hypothetical protein